MSNIYTIIDLADLTGEKWMDLPEWEGYYQVSDLGRIKSLRRTKKHTWGGEQVVKERIKAQKFNKDGYLMVELCKDKKSYTRYVHRLVAQVFILNPENKRTVNHKKGVITDNRAVELEWATYSENHKHAYRELGKLPNKAMEGRYGHHPNAMGVLCVTTGEVFKSAKSAAKLMNVNKRSILDNCHGKQEMAKGYKFKFA
jgi:hypothetical protein